ncbi:MerR family transcriptional regulator [Catenuloplanes atrovinosus]|uniref:DNA-binding transcriptional MerR regulator n=1 Tax=Catenuloplanes atrovinosus TaxID=137266 RepID=A0AAE3YMZ9_9ACTN|nr:MerR family transcriptional regulator [Catenuloplanes atrovinosus]MDR7276769.1 DNA-binding transcriptional MerR regulator [Catenuloplanes atrovinosus]
MEMDELYPIGDVARRTGLSVSAIRYYADAGVVAPAATGAAGHRLYDVAGIARLELVRTLRELDAGLDEIRRVLAGEATLRDLAATHLELVERQEGRLRTRRAVLRTILRQGSTGERVTLMHKLAGMSDEERDRLIDEFWAEVTDGLEVPERLKEWWRAARPVLPEQPTTAQLEAWIELADLVRDREVRQAVRQQLFDLCTTGAGPLMSSDPMLDAMEAATPIGQAAMDAARANVPPDSAEAREIAARWAGWLAEVARQPDGPQWRRAAADNMELADELDQPPSPDEGPYERYMSLVTAVNGAPERFPFRWLAAALRASA